MVNPYNDIKFATDYTKYQVSGANWYETEITTPALLRSVINTDNVLDYGCGSGFYTALMAHELGTLHNVGAHNRDTHFVGTDSSPTMVDIASHIKTSHVANYPLEFHTWDASKEDPPFDHTKFDRILAKLSLNYIAPDPLENNVFPRFHQLLTDSGLLLFVLPNPLHEARYDLDESLQTSEQKITVGSSNDLPEITTYRHSTQWLMRALAATGFKSISVLPLPRVRREYIKQLWSRRREEVFIADPTPLSNIFVSTAKRLIYIASTEEESVPMGNFFNLYAHFIEQSFPEIADIRSDFRTPSSTPRRLFDSDESIYVYLNHTEKNGPVVVVGGKRAENLSGRQKVRFANQLRALGIRAC